MPSLFRLVIASLLIFLSFVTLAEDRARTHDITIEDYFTQGFVLNCVISPQGDRVAYVERRYAGPSDPSNIDIWVIDTAGKGVRRLTIDPAVDERPQWSPDGTSLFFISNPKREAEKTPPYNGVKQVWRVDLASEKIVPLTSSAEGVDAFELSSDGLSLYYTTSKKHVDKEWKELHEGFSDLHYGHGVHKVSELWKMDLQSWRATRLCDHRRYIRDFDFSRDGSRAALITTPDELEISAEGSGWVEILDATTGIATVLPDDLWHKQAPSPYGWLSDPTWSWDGACLAFAVSFDGFPTEMFAAIWIDGKPAIRKLPRPEHLSVTGSLRWSGKADVLCFLADCKALKKVYAFQGATTDKPTTVLLTPDDTVVEDFSLSADGEQLALLQTGLTYSRDIFAGKADGKSSPVRITNVNPQIDTWKLPQISRFTWKGAKGDQVEGILELPPDYKRDKPLPMIVSLHGGPTDCDRFGFQFWFYGRTQLSTSGYAVFCPNYRGSTGYGDKFLTELIGNENNIEIEDIVNGIDALVRDKIADPDKLGVMGWSHGGYLSNCLTTGSYRFKAASVGAGVFDKTIQWSEKDTPGHVINFQQGLPWQQAERYRKTSPLFQLKPDFRTPILIHAGEIDERVPATHGKALHRALHRYIKGADTQLVLYPGAAHTISTYKHRLAKMKWDQAWFDRYVMKKK